MKSFDVKETDMLDAECFGFGERLRQQRLERRKSQQVVADFCLIRRATLSHYENGLRYPTVDVVKRIAEFLGCSVDYLLGMELQ